MRVATSAVDMLYFHNYKNLSSSVWNFSKLVFVTLCIFAMIFIVWPVLYHNFPTVIKAVVQKLSQSAFFKRLTSTISAVGQQCLGKLLPGSTWAGYWGLDWTHKADHWGFICKDLKTVYENAASVISWSNRSSLNILSWPLLIACQRRLTSKSYVRL